jgi:hypothetical protein
MVVHPGVLNSCARLGGSWLSILFVFFVAIAPGVAAVNSWTKPTSGFWDEQAYWSLGVLPDATQDVQFNNPGWKALAIRAQTGQNFPQSMQIGALTVAAPADSYNTLLMNFSGFERPLQTTFLSVDSNSSVVVLSSALDVSGNLFMGGTFIQSDYSYVKVNGVLSVGTFGGDAFYFLTNGTLVAGSLSMGFGLTTGLGKFVQYGGSNNVGNVDVNIHGEFDIYGGEANATNGITVGYGDYAALSSFYQYGGNVKADTLVNGNYILHGGTITGRMSIPSGLEFHREDGSVLQTGGTNFALSLSMGRPNRYGGMAFYTLSNGVLRVASSVTFNGGRFSQYNGSHTIVSNLVMQGTDVGLGFATADYFLRGGTFSAGGLTAQAGTFQQDGGTNLIAWDLVLSTAPPAPFTQNFSAGRYRLAGGFLSVNNITISNTAAFHHTGGTINHSGVLTLAQGNWHARPGAQALGPLRLGMGSLTNYGSNPTNSTIGFPASGSVLRLANSSAQPWDPSAILYITNWHGSASGGGETQLFVGSNASGLTSQQLARIKFSVSGGFSPARILATGEVVPQQVLTFSRAGNNLTLTWSPGWTLQSSTNVAGPYQDVQGATSPYMASMTTLSQFFRLRQ